MKPFKKFLLPGLLLPLLLLIAPATDAFAQRAPSANSRNWAGYAAATHGASAISGTWVVPSVGTSSTATGDAAWVGIGGLSSSDLIQTGTRALVQNGAVEYEAWYELIPAPAVPIAMTVHAGDTMRADIRETSTDIWQISLSDMSTGISFSITLPYHSSASSAEWVVEAAGTAHGTLTPLDRFSLVAFSGAAATNNGVSESPATLGAARLTLVDAALTPLAVPSALTKSGASFSVSRS